MARPGAPGYDEGPGGDQGLSSSYVTAKRPAQSKPRARRLATPTPPIVVAIVTDVVGGREGTTRSLLVWRCPVCPGGARHLSLARGDLPPTVRRRGPHGLVLLYVVGAAVAAA